MRGRLPASIAFLAAAAMAVPTASAQQVDSAVIYVNPTTGNDATCAPARADAPCRTLATAVDLAARRVMSATIVLAAGLHVVDRPLQFPAQGRTVYVRGLGGAQSVVRLTGAGRLESHPQGATARSQVTSLVITGDAPGPWILARDGTALAHLAIIRPRAGADDTVQLVDARLHDSVVRAVGDWSTRAVFAVGRTGLHGVTVSGGRVGFQSLAGGWPLANQLVASRSAVIYGGGAHIYNSAIAASPADGKPALSVESAQDDVPRDEPIVALSSITQAGCRGAVNITPSARRPNATVMVAGSLVQWPACGSALEGGGTSATVTWQSSVLQDPAGTPIAAQPAPLRIRVVNAGSQVVPSARAAVTTGGQWPASLMPVAGSPLLDFATDAVSAEVGINFPCSLTTVGPNCRADAARLGVLRPTGRVNLANPAPDAGPYEWSRAVGAPPAPPSADGIPMAPGPDGEPVPAIIGVDGAAQVPGAPQAGVDTGQRAAATDARRMARVTIVAQRTVRLGRALRVRVNVAQPARVKLVLRRALARPTARAATRVVGAKAVRLRRAGSTTVVIPLNSGARRGQMTVGATARQPGYEPGHDLEIVRVR